MRKYISYILYKIKSLKFLFSLPDKNLDNKDVINLREKGIVVINDFQKYYKQIDQLHAKIANLELNKIIANKNMLKKTSDDERAKQKKEFKIKITNLFNKESLLNFANNEYIKKIIKQYFGFEPTIRNISVWIDVPNIETQNEVATQIFHRDFDDIKLVKTFLYLNDVDNYNGPFEYIESSHLEPWNNNVELDNKSIIKDFGKSSLRTVVGKKNTLIIVDTNGYHHGKKLSNGHRLLVTVSYSSKNPSVKVPEKIFD